MTIPDIGSCKRQVALVQPLNRIAEVPGGAWLNSWHRIAQTQGGAWV